MGLITKFKEMFIEEDPEDIDKTLEYTREIELKKEVADEDDNKVETTTTISERELYQSPSTFKFPVIFEEEDLRPSVEEQKHYNFERPKVTKEVNDEERKFKSSPIISPIYGILDKNYNKDEITNKSDQPDYESKRNYKKNDIDAIRRKAFGTLEEDLEQSMNEDKNFIYGLAEEKEEEVDPIAEAMGLVESEKEDPTLEEAYENYTDYGVEYKAPETEEKEEPFQKTEVLGDDDLFNLINSMYKNDEEEEDK